MAILKSVVVPKNSGAAFEVRNRQRLRIAGKSIVDFVAFNVHDLTERFDQARTKTNQVKIFISTGDIVYSKRNNPMLTIVEDTFKEGRHDLQKGMCSRKRFEMVAQGISKRVLAEGVDINPKTAEKSSTTAVGKISARRSNRGIFHRMTCRARSIYFSACALIPTPASCTTPGFAQKTKRISTSEPKWIYLSPQAHARSRVGDRRFEWRFTTNKCTAKRTTRISRRERKVENQRDRSDSRKDAKYTGFGNPAVSGSSSGSE